MLDNAGPAALDCTTSLDQVQERILENYKPEIWTALKAALAVICSHSIKERAHPLALIFEGPSGRGKSTVINMCEPDRRETHEVLCRVDNFTPKSFVSHAASVPQQRLPDIDLLPKIRNKTMLTKELAPLFRGRETELRDNFSMLTTVLDGRGHKSSSGVHGIRGYEGRYLFNWLGATTPIPASTDAVMAQLGNRLLRFELLGQEESEQELIEFATTYENTTVEQQCRKAVNDFVAEHFKRCPLESVDPHKMTLSPDVVRQTVSSALLLASGRVEVARIEVGWNEVEFVGGPAEGPQRIILLLRTFLQALALINGRDTVSAEDVDTIRHLAFSSIPHTRRQMLRAVLLAGGHLTSSEAEATLGISKPTVRSWMKELAATGIVSFIPGSGNMPSVVSLTEKWGWLLPQKKAEESAENEVEVCVSTLAES